MDTYTTNMTAALTSLATTTQTLPDEIDKLIATDELQNAMQQYCEHSGKPCGKADYNQTRAMLAIHGRTTTLKILETQRKQVSMEWIWLNMEGLQNLAIHQPREFFIYICQKLLINQTANNELNRFEESVKAFVAIQAHDEQMLMPIIEMMRRLLGMSCQTNTDGLLRKFQRRSLLAVVSTFDNLTQFQADLQQAITTIVENKKKRKYCREGASLYRNMKMIAALSELEMSIGNEFNDFDLVEGRSAETVRDVLGGNRKAQTAKAKKQPKFAMQTTAKKGVFKLKLGGTNAN